MRTTILAALAALPFALAACDRKTSDASGPSGSPVASTPPPALDTAPPGAPPPKVLIDEVALAAKGASTVHVAWRIPPGTGVNEGAPFHVRWRQSDGLSVPPPAMNAKGADVEQGFDVELTPIAGAPGGTLVGDVDIVVCDVATHRVCVPVRREVELPFRVEEAAPAKATVLVPLPEAKP